ncbi:MAG: glycosyltransferase family 2 protein [Lachnospiraceae bacterium]|nr:glycosyltransferase family 2 protein [Lachnospiraceae bacterium]
MITVSVCMIVKNEEKVLARCLDSLAGLWEELIIVDTGSTDGTMEIAQRYTDQIYTFPWTGSFSDARNFSFSKATCDYIYAADADEVLEEENRQKFLMLKEAMLPEVEIVQMYYDNQLSQRSIYNFDREYRPKLYKRCRTFLWEEPIHEAVRLSPVVFDSDIVISHRPQGQHAGRDLEVFLGMLAKGETLSPRLQRIFLRELYFMGEERHLESAAEYLQQICDSDTVDDDTFGCGIAILCKKARLQKDHQAMLKFALKGVAGKGSAELCAELGLYFYEREDYKEAVLWFYNAAYETESLMDLKASVDIPKKYYEECREKLGFLTER